jgi:hypothetical protein
MMAGLSSRLGWYRLVLTTHNADENTLELTSKEFLELIGLLVHCK